MSCGRIYCRGYYRHPLLLLLLMLKLLNVNVECYFCITAVIIHVTVIVPAGSSSSSSRGGGGGVSVIDGSALVPVLSKFTIAPLSFTILLSIPLSVCLSLLRSAPWYRLLKGSFFLLFLQSAFW